MSFMFNPYPYDDPRAINHIHLNEEIKKTFTRNSMQTADKVASAINDMISKGKSCIVGIDGYISAPFEQFSGLVSLRLAQLFDVKATVLNTEEVWLDSDALHKQLLPYLPEDREEDPVLLYGRLYDKDYQSLMSKEKKEQILRQLKDFKKNGHGALIFYGNAALMDSFREYCDLKLFIDMTQKRTILNIRNGSCGNLGEKGRMAINLMLRRSYYVDFEIAMAHRGKLIRNNLIDYYITGDHPDGMQLLPLAKMKELFEVMVSYPLRCRPVYLEGVWGGFYVKKLRNLPKEMKNCAWVFDLIPMEVSIVADLADMQLEFPFYCFVQTIGEALMGSKAHKKFGGYFPIRFNYDDTFHSSGNMSIQVHPDGEFVKENNGELGRQDESYYMVVTGQQAKTYCGFKENADVEEFIEKAKRAEKYGEGFDHDAYVASVPSKPGMQFLIPAGTIHASGRNQLILEIGSLTIGSYTYKMYDYMRKDLEGNLRPIHTYYGDKVLRRDFKGDYVKQNFIQEPRVIRNDGFTETIVGEHDLIYFSLRNVIFADRYTDETTDRFHVLTLVDGEKCLIRSLTDPDKFFKQEYLDMVIIPAGFGPYEVINEGVGLVTMHKTLLKDGFENE
jgi:mannose-6-phosphate isomerase